MCQGLFLFKCLMSNDVEMLIRPCLEPQELGRKSAMEWLSEHQRLENLDPTVSGQTMRGLLFDRLAVKRLSQFQTQLFCFHQPTPTLCQSKRPSLSCNLHSLSTCHHIY